MKRCWWGEGGLCYHGKPDRDENGRSKVAAKCPCPNYISTRAKLETVIPGDKLVIVSELNGEK